MTHDASQPHWAATFIDYRRTEIGLITDLKRLRDISEKVGLEPATIQLIDDALLRNKDHRFSIAVVGEFKRGKSTFINALLGKDILPSDIEPCSATINRITYGLKPAVNIVFRDEQRPPEHIGIDQLAAYVTKLTPEAAAMSANVKEAVVTYPLAYLQNNVEIIDTPGLNDDTAMTEVTLGVLPHVAAAILVIMPESPFSGSEADFLNRDLLLKDLGRVMFVVTALDRVRKVQDRQRILEVIKKRIEDAVEKRLVEQFGSNTSAEFQLYRKQIGMPNVFGLSGADALEAKETNDQELLERSQFGVFESQLERFVTETRGAIELQVLANRTQSAGTEVLKRLTMKLGALQMSQQQFEATYTSAMNELQLLSQRRQDELRLIRAAADRTGRRVLPLIEQLGAQLKQAATDAVDSTTVTDDDITNAGFIDQLSKRVVDEVRGASRRIMDRVHLDVERDIADEVTRLGNFAASVNKTLYDIEMQFAEARPNNPDARLSKHMMTAAVGGLVSSIGGGILGGYQEAGKKGAAVGGITTLGAMILGTVLMPAAAPLLAYMALGAASSLAGKYVARRTFRDQRLENFKQTFKAQVIEQIDEQLLAQQPTKLVSDYISNAYKTVETSVIGELDTLIEQTRSTLDQLRSQKAREETLAEQGRKEIEEQVQEVNNIVTRTQSLSKQLIEDTNI